MPRQSDYPIKEVVRVWKEPDGKVVVLLECGHKYTATKFNSTQRVNIFGYTCQTCNRQGVYNDRGTNNRRSKTITNSSN